MRKKNKFKLLTLSLFTASVVGTSSCGITGGEVLQRAAGAAIGVGSAYLVPISPQDEIQLGQQMMKQISSQYKEYTANPKLVSYVRSIGAQIVKNASRKNEINYQFYVLDSPEINSFTIPGGSVFITTEILKYIKNEAELASILGHEVGHNERKHPVATIRRTMAAQGFAQGALSQADSALVQMLASTSLNLILNGYSRAQERQADETGVTLASKLGYDPQALSGFMQTLLSIYGSNPSRFVQLFQTHPGPQERIANIKNFIAKNHIAVKSPILNTSRFKQYVAVLPPKIDLKAAPH